MAATKEQLDPAKPSPAEPQSYIWSFPGAPVRIHLDLTVVQALQPRFRGKDAATQCGLLLGHVEGITTVVSGFQPLAVANASEIGLALTALAVSPGRPSAVGYYRAQRQEGLCLDEKDLALAEAFFRSPHNVILLVHPADPDPPNASFFFWDAGRLNGDFPFLEFPFDSNLLAAAEQHRAEAAQRRAFEIPAAAAAVPATGPKPGRRRLWMSLAWTFLVASLVVGAWVGMRFFPETFHWPPAFPTFASAANTAAASASAASQRPSMGLHAERQNGDLKLNWNREATVIASATSGVLSIVDGDSRRTIPLQATQVRAGSILYTPVSDQVQMDLAVSTPSDTVTESVLVLLPKTGPPQTLATRPPVHTAPAPASGDASRFQPAKPFTPPEPARSPASTPALTEPPAIVAANSAPPAAAPLWGGAAAILPPPVRPTPAPQASRPESVDEAPYSPAVPIRQVRPNFPVTLRTLVSKPTVVEITVTIDETGKVVKAEPKPQLGVHQTLVAVSLVAAREWTFRPARQGGRPVPGQMLLRFNFSPNL